MCGMNINLLCVRRAGTGSVFAVCDSDRAFSPQIFMEMAVNGISQTYPLLWNSQPLTVIKINWPTWNWHGKKCVCVCLFVPEPSLHYVWIGYLSPYLESAYLQECQACVWPSLASVTLCVHSSNWGMSKLYLPISPLCFYQVVPALFLPVTHLH